jgi:hypothetical protein
MKSRRIKVAAFYRSLQPQLKVASSLRLRGEWLRQAGFHPGDLVEIDVEPGYLVIKKKEDIRQRTV